MSKPEPDPDPSNQSEYPLFFIGQNSDGRWVARDQTGLRGGVFIDREKAFKFALFENGHRREAIVTVPGPLELNTGRSQKPSDHIIVVSTMPRTRQAHSLDAQYQRRKSMNHR